MPDKHPNSERWGGPGASHEDASKPQPPKTPKSEAQREGAGESRSGISGGGGELDKHHTHDPKTKS